MLTGNYTFNKESFTLFDSEQLADTINHDIKKMPIAQMCLVTHNYDILFIEKVLDAIELQADIDRFAGILKICLTNLKSLIIQSFTIMKLICFLIYIGIKN